MNDIALRTSVLVGLALCLASVSANAGDTTAPSDTLRIMCLGDSRTAGPTSRDCYRLYLDRMLTAAGYTHDFVGGLTTHENNTRPADSVFDKEHEGHWGWTTDKLLWDDWSHPPQGMGTWARTHTPDIVLAMLGTTDILQESGANKCAVTQYEIMFAIDTLRAANPSVAIILANVYPAGGAFTMYNPDLARLDSLLPHVVDSLNTPQSPIILVDTWTGFDPATDLVDVFHANQKGSIKIATKFFDALMPFFDSIPTRTSPRVTTVRVWTDASGQARILFPTAGFDASRIPVFTAGGRRMPNTGWATSPVVVVPEVVVPGR